MEGFFSYLIILGIVAVYSVVLIIIYKHFFVDAKEPDAILYFVEEQDKVKGDFVVLLPIDEMRKRDYIKVEIQNAFLEESQEKHQV